MFRSSLSRRVVACLSVGAIGLFGLPAAAAAHADLERSDPAAGATVPSPFAGPIVLTFSEALGDGSRADLIDASGAVIAAATVDGPGATMTITLDADLAPGDYEVRWVSVAADGDLQRDTFSFTVAPAPPTASPSPSAAVATPSPTATEAAESPAPASPTPLASPGASPGDTAGSSAGDVLLPIVVALFVVGAGAVYFLRRRNRSTLP